MPRTALAAALKQIDAIVRPPGDLYFTELRAQNRQAAFPASHAPVRRVRGATPAGQPALDAVRHLRSNGTGVARPTRRRSVSCRAVGSDRSELRTAGWTSCAIASACWTPCGPASGDATCLRRPACATPTRGLGLLAGSAWEAARPRSAAPSASRQMRRPRSRLAERLDVAYRGTAANLPDNAAVPVEGSELVLTALEQVDEPASLVALKAAVAARMPRVDLPELLLEITPAPGLRTDSPMQARAAHGRRVATSIAPCCWPKRATRGSNL